MRKTVATTTGAKPIGPYSQAIIAEGKFVYFSGQGPLNPDTGQLVLGSFREQALRTFTNLGLLLSAAGAGWDDVVKVNVYLSDLDNFGEMNEIYRQFMHEPFPARTTVGAALLMEIAIEVDAVAVVPG